LEKQTALGFDSMDAMRLTLGHDMSAGHACVTGPYLVTAETLSGPWIDRLNVFVEPRIKVLAHADEADVTEAFDVSGDPLPIVADRDGARWRDRRESRHSTLGDNAFDVSLPVPLPRAARIRGTVKAVVLSEQETVEIKDIAQAKATEHVVNGERYQVSLLKPAPDQWRVLLTVFNVTHADRFQMGPKVLDADGNATSLDGDSSMSGGGRLDLSLNCPQRPARGTPAKLKIFKKGQSVEIPLSPAKDAERTVDGRRYLVDVRSVVLGEWLVTLIAVPSDPASLGATDLQPVLLDAKGTPLDAREMVGGSTDVRIHFRQGPDCGPPAKLLLPTFKKTREVVIAFQFGYAK
jgi:hypothetical protein